MNSAVPPTTKKKDMIYTSKDFMSDQLVRWCPGCGDYAILAAMSKALPKLGISKENIVFVSGIGCAARFPYYINTYGFHTIHGRGPAIATGVKLANPNLSVWVIQGDGDALAIGGNHFIHAARRNIDMNILVFNNEIYGLTKGQCSPTSSKGLITKSTPQGVFEKPFRMSEVALSAGASFFARAVDMDPKKMTNIFLQAARHKGTSIIEILQNCVVFNDAAHASITAKENRDDFQLHLEHGQPMLFGEGKTKGLYLDGLQLKVAVLGKEGVSEKDILIHDARNRDTTLHALLARLAPPDFPMAIGVIRNTEEPDYADKMREEQIRYRKSASFHYSEEILHSGKTWEMK